MRGAVADAVGMVTTVLGPYEDLAPTRQPALGDGTGYFGPLLDAVWRAARASTSREGFERLLTLTNAPTIGPVARTVRTWYRGRSGLGGPGSPDGGLTAAEYRAALRWARRAIRDDCTG